MDQKKQNFWAMACHLSTFVGFLGVVPFGNFLLPLVIWLVFRKESEAVDDQGRESLNFQFSLMVHLVGLVVAALVIAVVSVGWNALDPRYFSGDLFFGFVMLPLIVLVLSVLFACVLVVYAAVEAFKGRRFRYPWAIRIF